MQYIECSIKFYSTLPNCRKRSNAVFSLLHLLDIPCTREVRGLDFLLDVFVHCVQLPLCVQFWPQIPLQSSFAPPALLCASRSRFSLSTVSVLLSSLYTLALVTQHALIRSFVRSKTDRPSRTVGICRWQNCRSSSAALVFFTIFFLRLPLFDAV